MNTVAVTPIIGEFGYTVFDVQPRVRAWLRQRRAERKVVFASRALAPLFEEATEIIEPPRELLPTAPATMRSIVYEHWSEGDPQRVKIEALIEWARSTVVADDWLEIPYFLGRPWNAPATFTQLEGCAPRPDRPYVVVAARAREFDSWRNWPKEDWDELVRRVQSEWGVGIYAIGEPPSTYFPAGAVPQEVERLARLDHSVSLLNGAMCSISSNSGPTHLSLMAGCPTFAWGEPYLKSFMERFTNPLGTPCTLYPGGWDPNVDSVWRALCRFRAGLEAGGTWDRRLTRSLSLSMCMIARDSARTIAAALDSVKPWVDEMIVLDTGSSDDTISLAEARGARVFRTTWPNSFAEARNESVQHARGKWIFWMDSDDTIDEANGRKLRELVEARHSPSTMGYVMQVHCPANRVKNGQGGATAVDHVKVFRNFPAIRFTGRIHEQILPTIRSLGGDVGWTDLFVTHSGSDQSPEGRAAKHQRDMRLLELEMADDPDNTFSLFNMGMTLLDMDRPGDALAPLCRSLQLAVTGDSHLRKVYALLVQAYVELNRYGTAYKTCLQGLGVCPGDPELLFRRGGLEQLLGKLHEAEASYGELLTLSVTSIPNRHFASVDLEITGAKVWHNLGIVYEQLRQFDQAAEAWRQVLSRDAGNVVAWHGLLAAYSAKGDQNGLQDLASQGIGANTPEDVRIIANARLCSIEGGTQAALLEFKRGLAQSNSIALLEAACEHAFVNHKFNHAEKWLLELSRRRPHDPSVHQNLATVYLARHNYGKATEHARRSLTLRPNHEQSHAILRAAEQFARAADSLA